MGKLVHRTVGHKPTNESSQNGKKANIV